MQITLVSPFDPDLGCSDNPDGHAGGVERVLANYARQLADRDHEVTVVCSTDDEEASGWEDGLQVLRVPRRGTLFRAPIAPLTDHVPEGTDLLHVPATYPFTTPRALHRASKQGMPSVLDFHFEPHPDDWLGRLAARVYRGLATRTYAMADRVLVRSYDYGRNAPSLGPVPEQRWRALPNGIDPDRFSPRPGRQGDDYLLFVGRLVPYKGLSVLFEALARGDIDRPLRVAGDGPLRDQLEAQASRLDIDVDFLGHVPDQTLPDLYRGAALTVLPSVNRQEAFGISLLESMACGTPVVASRLPGVRQVANEGGFVAEPGNADELADALAEALEPDRLPEGRPLAGRIHERYAWEAVVDRLVDVYEQALVAG